MAGNRGPRIIVKADAESSIGRGCVLYAAHFRPEIAAMPRAASAAAMRVDPRIKTIRMTEGDRPQRKDKSGKLRRDLHSELRAIDFTFEYENGQRVSQPVYYQLRGAMREELGEDYDVAAHAVGTDALHIHSELDPV